MHENVIRPQKTMKTNLIGLIKTQSNRIIASVEWIMARSLIRSQLNQVFSGFILREMNFAMKYQKHQL